MAEWYERDGAYPAGVDRDGALQYLAQHWYAVVPAAHVFTGKTDAPQNLLLKSLAAKELEPVYAGRAFKARTSPEPFLDHVAISIVPEVLRVLYAGPLLYEEIRQWLRDNRLPRKYFRSIANKYFLHDELALSALVEEFNLVNLPAVMLRCSPERLFWPYCLVSFRRFVSHRYKAELEIDPDASGEPPDPGTGPEGAVSERQLRDAKHKEFASVQLRWYAEELKRHKKAPASAGATPWIDAAGGIPSGLERKCSRCVRLWVFWLSVAEWSNKDIADLIGITPNNCKVQRSRALHRLKQELARYPVAFVPGQIDGTWRIQMNRWAFWPTTVLVSCAPEDLASVDAASITIAEGSSRSHEPVRLRSTPYDVSRPTALVFDRSCAAGEAATGRLLIDQALLVASAHHRSAATRAHVPSRSGRAVVVNVSSSSPSVRIRRARVPVGPGVSSVDVEVETIASGPQPASLSFDPAALVGGLPDDDDEPRMVVTMGARVVAEAGGRRVEGVLAIVAPRGTVTPVLLSSADPAVARPCVPEWHADQATFDIGVEVEPVAAATTVTMTARANGGTAAGALAILPLPIESFSLDEPTLRAGSKVDAVIEFARRLVAPTRVTVTGNHNGVRVMPSPLVAPAGATRTKFAVMATDEAQSGTARLVAAANGSEAATTIAVVANAIDKVTLTPPTLVAGSRAKVSVTCRRAVTGDVPLRLRANRTVKLVNPATVIPAGRDRTDFEIEALDVERHSVVAVEIDAFGTSMSAELRISPAPSRQLRGERS